MLGHPPYLDAPVFNTLLLRLLRLPQNDISAPACIAAAFISRPALRCAAAPLDCAGCISATPPRSKSTLRGSLSWHAAAGCPCSCTCGPRQQTFWILCSSMQVGWVGRGGQDRGQGRAAAGQRQGRVQLGSAQLTPLARANWSLALPMMCNRSCLNPCCSRCLPRGSGSLL